MGAAEPAPGAETLDTGVLALFTRKLPLPLLCPATGSWYDPSRAVVRTRVDEVTALVDSTYCELLTAVCACVTGATWWLCACADAACGEVVGEVLVRKSRVRRCSCCWCSSAESSRTGCSL